MRPINTLYIYYKLVNLFRTGYSIVVPLFLIAALPLKSFSQAPESSPEELKKLSMEELMNIEVTSVSKMSEKLSEAASAIQVITQNDIKRSAATSVPEALRLSPNLQVTQINAHHWVISARGFNNIFANKLLVMIDGRTVYSPLFAGVFWDAQNVVLEDIDRIEVISGPGGTLWGANAVNGVINIITKTAKNTQGIYVAASVGTALENQVEARYGGNIGEKLSYKVYGHHSNRNNTVLLADNKDNIDNWNLLQGGFSMDWDPSNNNAITLQGNFYEGEEDKNPNPYTIDGQNILGKWSHSFSDSSNLTFQAYADRTWRRDVPGTINDELFTYDFDLQHNFSLHRLHNIIWGLGYRFMNDKTQNSTQFVGFLPNNRKMHLFSSFIQDEIKIVPERLSITIGTKLQHNNFTGFELQPSARLSYTPFMHQILWVAVSRAIRAPSRIDVDYRIPTYDVPPSSPSVAGGPNFVSEKVLAYELGYRIQPLSNLSLSLATFYNEYDDLYSVEPLPGTLTYQIQNGVEGYSYGGEFLANYSVSSDFQLRGGYTYFDKKLNNKPQNLSDPSLLTNFGSDAKHQFLLQSKVDLPGNFQFDLVGRYMDKLPATLNTLQVASYFTLDARVAWEFKKQLELSVAGQRLLENNHVEVGGVKLPRGVYGKITWRY